MWGIGAKRSTQGSIKLLEKASARGNAAALAYLLELVRKGDGGEIKKSSKAAKRYVEKYAGSLTPEKRDQELILIEANNSRSRPALSRLATAVREKKNVRTTDFVRRLFKVNPNLGVYLAQAALKDHQLYNGAMNGLATRSTIAAILDACSGKLAGLNCTGPAIGENIISQIAVK